MGKVILWVDVDNFNRVRNGLSAVGFPDESLKERIQLALPLTAVVPSEHLKMEWFTILESEKW